MIRTTTLCVLISAALFASASFGLGAERRASQRVKTAVHYGMDADAAVKKLVATLPGTDRNVIITPDAGRNIVIIQAPGNQIRRFLQFLNRVDPFAFGVGIVY